MGEDANGVGDARGRSATDPTRIVADADVLAADVLVGGAARAALDHVRGHSWLSLVASDPLLADAAAVIGALADADLAETWRDRIDADRSRVEHPPGDHPALASAYEGSAAHLLSFDPALGSARANLSLQSALSVSVRTPDAFDRVFDPEGLYEATNEGAYPGPDRDPRA